MTPALPSRLSNIAFGSWIVGGIALVIANGWLAEHYFIHYGWSETFWIVGREAEYELGRRLHLLLQVFFFGSLVYGPLGAVLFRRHEGGTCGCLAGGFLVFVFVLVGQVGPRL